MDKQEDAPRKIGKKVRVDFRRNRSERVRQRDWTRKAAETDDSEIGALHGESVNARGDSSRRRTVIIAEDEASSSQLPLGTVIGVSGRFADVDDGTTMRRCTIRRILRTRMIEDRHPVCVGDKVRFRLDEKRGKAQAEGVIESVEARTSQLRRGTGNRVHTIVANINLAVIAASALDPPPKPGLIDRYTVSALAGGITPAICMNKIDLDESGRARRILDRYAALGWSTIAASAVTGEGVDALRSLIAGKSCVIVGQSGVGKSSLLNCIQPGLALRVGDVSKDTGKGRHTTTTARLIRLDAGGYIVDTPGIRAFEMGVVPRNELELHFVEFVAHVANCRFPDCSHIHEGDCAVLEAVHSGAIHKERYESYVRLMEEPDQPKGR